MTADLRGTLLYGCKVGCIYMEDSASLFLEISLDLELLRFSERELCSIRRKVNSCSNLGLI